MAKAYHSLQPYPQFSPLTKDWKTEERGPYPRCLPFVRHVVEKGARWLFGKSVSLRVEEDKETSDLLNAAWSANSMSSRMIPGAVTGALTGGVVLKWSYDETRSEHPCFDVLDPSEHVRLYFDPSDVSRLLMARVQYPVPNYQTGKWDWYREDWTDDTLQVYDLLPSSVELAADPYAQVDIADRATGWKPLSPKATPSGEIPLTYIQNRQAGGCYGDGDLWALYHVVDLINFTYNLAHQHNQKHIKPDTALIDLEPVGDDDPSAGASAEVEVYKTASDATSQGKAQLLEASGSVREHVKGFSDDLLKMVYDACGSVDISPEEVTNKGNLTTAVLTQLYAPLIEATEGKRQSYGPDGLCRFMEKVSRGMAHLGVKGWKEAKDVQVVWAPFFEESEDEKASRVNRLSSEVEKGFSTQEMAQRKVLSENHRVDDVEEVLKKLPKEAPVPAGEAGVNNNGK
jgi:hypothetical protein